MYAGLGYLEAPAILPELRFPCKQKNQKQEQCLGKPSHFFNVATLLAKASTSRVPFLPRVKTRSEAAHAALIRQGRANYQKSLKIALRASMDVLGLCYGLWPTASRTLSPFFPPERPQNGLRAAVNFLEGRRQTDFLRSAAKENRVCKRSDREVSKEKLKKKK